MKTKPNHSEKFTITLASKQLRYLRRLDDGNISAILQRALRWYSGQTLWTVEDCSDKELLVLKSSDVEITVDATRLWEAMNKVNPVEFYDAVNVWHNHMVKDYSKPEFIRRLLWIYIAEILGCGVFVERVR